MDKNTPVKLDSSPPGPGEGFTDHAGGDDHLLPPAKPAVHVNKDTTGSPIKPVAELSTTNPTIVLDYYYDDPSQTELHGILTIPPLPLGSPEFTVVGWKGLPDVVVGTPAYQAAQVWGAIASTLAYVLNLKSTPRYMQEWSATYNLVAIPRAGNQLNAYYDRSSLRFFWGQDPKNKKPIYTCDAVGIVAHELGHAVLDSMRPDLWNTAVLEFFAFHEAFGDILAVASTLQHDMVIEQMLKETTAAGQLPDLWQSNVVSRLAEELGHAIYYTSNMTIGAERYLRNCFNTFKYVDPLALTLGTTDAVLTQEPHNFSRVFSGAWYECFCELFKNDYVEHNHAEAIISVKESRDIMIRALLDAILIAPSQLQFFQAMALSMVYVLTQQKKEREAEIIKNIFKRRNLWNENQAEMVTGSITAPLTSTSKVDPSLPEYHMQANIGATTSHPSKNIIVELPKWVALDNGKDLHAILTKSVAGFLNYAADQSLLGDEYDNNMFAVSEDGRLMRNYICSSFRAMPQMSVLHDNIGNIAR